MGLRAAKADRECKDSSRSLICLHAYFKYATSDIVAIMSRLSLITLDWAGDDGWYTDILDKRVVGRTAIVAEWQTIDGPEKSSAALLGLGFRLSHAEDECCFDMDLDGEAEPTQPHQAL